MSRKHSLHSCAAACALLTLAPGFAQGAEAEAGAVPAAKKDSDLIEIVVTANKRAENLQEVPMTLSAFTSEILETQGVQSVVDLPELTPGLGFTRTLVGTNAFLRGVGTTSAGYSTEAPIATYLDGLYLPNSAASSFSFNNIERIEVLKGPQGTLYGRNSTGGLISVITKDPGDKAALDVSASYANYNNAQLNFYGSTPITDTVSANLAVMYDNQGDGWGKNIYTGRDAFTFRDLGAQAKVKWTPTPDTTVTLRGFFDRTNTDEGNAVAEYPGSTGSDGTPSLGKYQIDTRLTPYAEQRQGIISLKAEQDFDFAKLTSITGYIDNYSPSLQTQGPILGQPIPGQGTINLGGNQTAKSISQEFQLASDSTKPLQWIVGTFYYHDDTMIQTQVWGTCIGRVCATPPPVQSTGYQKTISYSGYADGTYSFWDATHLTLGLRYTSDEKILTGNVVPLAGFPDSFPAFPPGYVTAPGMPFAGFPSGIDTDVTFGQFTYRAVLAQDITDTMNAYASYNRGFKSGGFNPTSFTNPASRPEILDAYEVGMKSELLERKLRLNLSGFYYNYDDMQLRTSAAPAPPGGTILYNAASSEIKGIDADFEVATGKGLMLNGGFEYLDAAYTSFPGAVCTHALAIGGSILGGTGSTVCNLSGNTLPQAPKFSYTLGLTYDLETDFGEWSFNINDSYKSTFAWEPDNRLKQPGYHIVNSSLLWMPEKSDLSVEAYGRNLGSSYYFVSGANAGGNDGYVPGAPRTYGVKVRYKF